MDAGCRRGLEWAPNLCRGASPVNHLRNALLGLSVTTVAALSWAGCSNSGSDTGSSDEAIIAGDCQIFSVQKQANISLKELGRSDDPVVKKILKATCPQNYKEIQTKLNKNDKC